MGFWLAAMIASGAMASAPPTALTVTYYPNGKLSGPVSWTLVCRPAHGTHPAPGRACLELRLPRAAAELGPPKPCTILPSLKAPYAIVRGTVGGTPVKRVLRPGCDNAAWHDLHFLLTGA